ncbi:MAG: choice-of-anchor B family protein, partial [Bacteroidota bacterium]|nr:choice-of-anchor B family protein [Bacteroidota bacterium]
MIRMPLFACALVAAASMHAQTPCVDGFAGDYPCEGLDLLSVRSLEELGGGANGNDCWGWVDPESDREFVLYGRSNGLSVVEVTDPVNPVFVARVPTATVQSLWRDVKVYDNHAFIVSEAAGHGMQVVDLTEVLDVELAPATLTPVAVYLGFGNAHNIVMNEASGHAYGVGTNTAGGGLHAVDVSDPTSPMVAGTYDGAYTHDAQVVMYEGPDADHAGQEIAFCFNGSAGVAIVDVTDKTDMQLVSSFNYTQSAYTHQGWLNEDQTMVYFNDELDEQGFGNGTRTYIADVSDLDNPVVLGFYEADNTSVDHNLYIRGNKVYASNYMSGLRVSTILPNGNLEPYVHFDVRPDSDTTSFYGTWSNYPYFPSG